MREDEISLGTVEKARDVGKNGSYRYMWIACEDCEKQRWVVLYKGEPKSTLCKSCANRRWLTGRTRELSPAWKGGRTKTVDGYVNIYLSLDSPFFPMTDCTGHIREHRLIIAKQIGRCLSDIEVVHHLNGIKDDNRIENLVLSTNNKHQQVIPDFKNEIRRLEETIRNQAIRIRRLELKIEEILACKRI